MTPVARHTIHYKMDQNEMLWNIFMFSSVMLLARGGANPITPIKQIQREIWKFLNKYAIIPLIFMHYPFNLGKISRVILESRLAK